MEIENPTIDSQVEVASPDVLPEVDPAPPAEVKEGETPEAGSEEQKPETPEQEQRRLSRRARSNERKAAELAAAQTEARMLREQLEAIKRPQEGPKEPKREDFDDWEKYQDARQDWRNDVRDAQRAKEAPKTQAPDPTAVKWEESEREFAKKVDDYADVATHFIDGDSKRLSPQAKAAIVELGAAVLYGIADIAESTPEEFERIVKLSPARQIAELTKLEAKYAEKEKPKVSAAPAPAKHITSGRTAESGKLSDDMDVYMKQRAKEGARWAR